MLHTTGRLSVPARSALTVKLNFRDLHGKPLPVGTAGVNYAAMEGLGVWNTLDTCHWHGQVSAVVVNTADADRYFQNNEILVLFDPIKKESLVDGDIDDKIDACFNSFKNDPDKKTEGFVPTPMTSEEKDFLLSQLNVKSSHQVES